MGRLPDHPVRRRGRRPRRPARRGPVRLLGAGLLSGRSAGRRVVLLRHGRTAHNAGGVMQGQLDVALDETGLRQAAEVAPLLAALRPSVVVTSDLSRARDTAVALVEHLDGVALQEDPRLRELHLGDWQGLTVEQARERHPEQHAAWLRGEDVARGGGETYRQAGERAAAAVQEALPGVPEGGTLVAVTHGGTARAAVAVLLELAHVDSWRLAALGNCCWTQLHEGERGWRLEKHGVGVLASAEATPASPDAEPVR